MEYAKDMLNLVAVDFASTLFHPYTVDSSFMSFFSESNHLSNHLSQLI